MQLQMVWPEESLGKPPDFSLLREYELRAFRQGDELGHVKLMVAAGFESWNEEQLTACYDDLVSEGFFLVVHKLSREPVATAMALDNASELHPAGGEMGWVAASPHHSGNGLGLAACAAVTRRLLLAEYKRIYLKTDDWRLAALKVYLKLGFVPFLHAWDMEERWRVICGVLGWPFVPNTWPRAVAELFMEKTAE